MATTDTNMIKSLYCDASPNAEFRDRMTGDGLFVNYGISLDGNKPADVKTANMNMVDWAIKKLDITKDSYVLEVGCGKGGFLLEIAQKTGCKFIGTDIVTSYVEVGKKAVADSVLSDKGDIIEASYQNFTNSLDKNIILTHIVSFGSLYYVHPDIDMVLQNFASVSHKDTKILLWDMASVDSKKECPNFKRHMKLQHELLDVHEFGEAINRSQFRLEE